MSEPGIGHNYPPAVDLEAAHATVAGLKPRADHLLEQAAKIPEDIPEDQIGEIADFIKAITTTVKALETARVGAKEPYLTASRQVDGLFGAVRDPLQKIKVVIERRLGITLRAKEQREREAERQRREAERRAAEERQREADRIANEERVRLAEKQREADEAAEKARKLEEEARSKAAVKRAQEQAERRKRELAEVAERAKQADKVAAGEQRRVDAATIKVAQVDIAKPAEFARTRGEYGGVGTLKRYWTFAELDRDTLDLETLRNHLPMDALEKAVRAFIAAGGRKLSGVRIYEDDKAGVS